MSNVHQLHTVHPERIQRIRDWHQAQAAAEQVPVALLAMSITDCGQVNTSGLAIEPAHALIFLDELDRLRVKLTAHVVEHAPELLRPQGRAECGQVIRLHRG